MEHSVTGKINLLSALAPNAVKEIRETRRMTQLKSRASDTLEGLLRPLVLVVDDDRDFRDGLRAHLQASELCRSVAVPSAAAAIKILARDPVQLVVTDFHMPVMDGAAFLRIVQKRWPDVVRVMMSGSSAKAVRRGGLMSGFLRKQESLMVMTDALLSLIPGF
ncbi:MAG: response regulator [bacterium]|nr:response regulator [bacterium]